MNRKQLEHAIRAACEIAGDTAVIVMGSQSVLGQFPEAPGDVTTSIEVDMYPLNYPERSILLDGAIGELSLFHSTHGFYVHGIGPETAVLPEGWRGRLVPVKNENTQQAEGLCLDVHDMAASKLAVPFREHDSDFVAALLWHKMVGLEVLNERLEGLPLKEDERSRLVRRLDGIARAVTAARKRKQKGPPSMEGGSWPSEGLRSQ